MAEPRTYQLLQRVQSDLAGIVGDGGATYHYTPAKVYIVTTWADPRLWDQTVSGPIYAVRRDDRNLRRRSTGDSVNGPQDHATVRVSVLVSQAFSPSSPDDTPDEALVVERMLKDVIRKLAFEDPSLGVVDTDDVEAEGGADDGIIEDAPKGWACGEITFPTTYSYPASAP